jgi:hypothetical protein
LDVWLSRTTPVHDKDQQGQGLLRAFLLATKIRPASISSVTLSSHAFFGLQTWILMRDKAAGEQLLKTRVTY